MPIVKKAVIVPYTPQQMFELVNDVQKYPEFIPACVKSEIITQTEDEIHARLFFARSGIQKSFATINRLMPHKMIEIRLLEGPFKQLEGFWRFETVDEVNSKIMLDLEFEFSTGILALMFGPVFNQMAGMLVDTFTERAKVVYKD